jgi:hypothetical protein
MMSYDQWFESDPDMDISKCAVCDNELPEDFTIKPDTPEWDGYCSQSCKDSAEGTDSEAKKTPDTEVPEVLL